MSEPAPPKSIELVEGVTYSIWDKWEVNEPDMTVSEFVDHWEAKLGLEVSSIVYEGKLVFMPLIHGNRKNKKLTELLKTEEVVAHLAVNFYDEKNDNDVGGPDILFRTQ